MSKPDETLKTAVKRASDILADYVQPGPRNCERTLDQLLETLDNDAVAEAVAEIEDKENGRRSEEPRTPRPVTHQRH
jgi:hypothetical protein